MSVPVAGEARPPDLFTSSSDEICKDMGTKRSNDVIALLKDVTIATAADIFSEIIQRGAWSIGRLIELRWNALLLDSGLQNINFMVLWRSLLVSLRSQVVDG